MGIDGLRFGVSRSELRLPQLGASAAIVALLTAMLLAMAGPAIEPAKAGPLKAGPLVASDPLSIVPAPRALPPRSQKGVKRTVPKFTASQRRSMARRWKRAQRLRLQQLGSPKARQQRRASKTAFRGLSGAAAVTAVRKELPVFAAQPLWSGPELKKGEKIEEYVSETTARMDVPGSSKDALVVSPAAPMAVERPDGSYAPLKFDLTQTSGGWVPSRPAVQAVLGKQLGDGVRLGQGVESVVLKPQGNKQVSGIKRETKLFYPSVAPDTDVLAEAVPQGVSLSYALRSPAAGERSVTDVELPAGVKMRLKGGAIVLVRGESVVGAATAPVAFDAQGTPLEAKFSILDEDSLAIDVQHRRADVAYPIAVDPVWWVGGTPIIHESGDYDMSTPGRNGYGYGPQAGYAGKFQGWDNGSYYGILVNGGNGPGGSAWWAFPALRASYIFRADFTQVAHAAAGSCLWAGLYGPGGWSETGYGAYSGGSSAGPFVNCAGMGSTYVTTCVQGYCDPAYGSAGNIAAVQVQLPGSTGNGGGINFQGGFLFIRDHEEPSFPQGWGVDQTWRNSGAFQGTVQVRDPGLGLRGADMRHNDQPSPSSLGQFSCSGDYINQCPEYGYVGYDMVLPEGVNKMVLEPYDIVERRNDDEVRYVRVDTSAPKVVLHGQLAARKDRVVAEDTRLRIKATDGSNASNALKRSGVQSISGKLQYHNGSGWTDVPANEGGTLTPASNPSCPAESCELEANDYIFTVKKPNGTDRPLGRYRVVVTASDFVGNSNAAAPETLEFELGAGKMVSVIDGQRTARSIPLQAATTNNQTAVKFQYRRPKGTNTWTDIPISQLKYLDTLETVSTATVPLSEIQGSTKYNRTLVWDLTQDTSIGEEPVEVVAVFTGGVAGKSDDMRVDYDQAGLGSPNGKADVGPGSLDVVMGNFSMEQKDVEVSAYKTDLSVARTYNSRDYRRTGEQPGIFGDGWSTTVPGLEDAPDFSTISYEPPTVENYGDDWDPIEVVEPGYAVASGGGGTITFDEDSNDLGGFKTEWGFENMRLERQGTSEWPTGFKLIDRETNRELVFERGAGDTTRKVYTLASITDLSNNTDKATYQWQVQTGGTLPRLRRVIAPATPGGSTCNVAQLTDTPAIGCRWLDLQYGAGGGGNTDRLTSVTFHARTAGGTNPVQMASYTYYGDGRLQYANDLRANTRTAYEYGDYGLLTKVTPSIPLSGTDGNPAGDRPWVIAYGRQTIDRGWGRLDKVTRTQVPVAGGSPQDATTNVAWFVSLGSTNGSPDLSPALLSRTGQIDRPVQGTAILPPGAQTWEWAKGTIHYFNPAGRVVNVAAPGGRVSTTEHDVRGNVVRALTAQNRLDAFNVSGSDSAAQEATESLKRSTISQWCQTGPGSRLEAEWSPERQVKLANGTTTTARTKKELAYGLHSSCPATAGMAATDDDTSKRFPLVTQQKVSALTGGTVQWRDGTNGTTSTLEPMDRTVSGGTEADTRTTTTEYIETLGHAARYQPKLVTVDPGGASPQQTRTIYDSVTGVVTQQRMPRDPGTDDASTAASPSTRQTIYYTAGANTEASECGNKPEWATWPCIVRQRGYLNTSGLPKLMQAKTTSYDNFGRPLTVTEHAQTGASTFESAAIRTRTFTYRADGQPLTASVSTTHSGSTSMPTQTNTYDSNGRLKTTTNGTKTITRTYDTAGRLSTYQDADSITSTTSYDLQGRVKETWSSDRPTAKRTNTYDGTTGDLTSVSDPDAGTIAGGYDADGRLLEQTYQTSGVRIDSGFDAVGKPTKRITRKTTNCSSNCVWHTSEAISNAHGQVATQTGTNAAEEKREYSYDTSGRITRASDTLGGQCTVRDYEYTGDDGKNGNRTKLTTKAPQSNGTCDPAATGSSVTYAYDAGDRLLRSTRGSTSTPDYSYDALGRITTVPAADAGGKQLTATYYANDLVREMTQDSKTTTIALDPQLRVRSRTTTGASDPEIVHYGDDTDEPLFTEKGSVKTREIEGIDGDLIAVKKDSDSAATLQISNLHGDVIAEAPNTANSAGPGTTRWDTDEFGVPRQTSGGGGGGGTPATITKVGTSTKAAATGNVTSLAIAKPTGVQEGDLLLAGLSASSGTTITAPAGWTAISGAEVVSGSSKWQMFSKYASASEGANYTFSTSQSGKSAGGITALRDTATSDPINAVATSTGFGTNITAPSVTPTADGSAIELLFGSNTGDNNGGEAWSVSSPLGLDWSAATGASASGNRNAGMALTVLTGGANTATGTFSVSNLTGNNSNVSNAAITAAISPATTGGGSGNPTYQQLPKHAYLGAKQRSTTLPTGVIEMGARLYLPHLGRFLQTDPVYGGSANAYDYGLQDPANLVDLDGRKVACADCGSPKGKAIVTCANGSRLAYDPVYKEMCDGYGNKCKRGAERICGSKRFWNTLDDLCLATSAGAWLLRAMDKYTKIRLPKSARAAIRNGTKASFYVAPVCIAAGYMTS